MKKAACKSLQAAYHASDKTYLAVAVFKPCAAICPRMRRLMRKKATAANSAGIANKPMICAALMCICINQPPTKEPTTEPERPAAFAQLTPVARQWVG